jgi:superfamily I DNA/RNA helicase
VVEDGDVLRAAATATLELAGRYGSVGVIVPDDLRAELGLIEGAQVVSPSEAKGLEFDGVVVVEPAAIVESAPDRSSGLRLLYVALTRAVQELTVVHARPLPQALS